MGTRKCQYGDLCVKVGDPTSHKLTELGTFTQSLIHKEQKWGHIYKFKFGRWLDMFIYLFILARIQGFLNVGKGYP